MRDQQQKFLFLTLIEMWREKFENISCKKNVRDKKEEFEILIQTKRSFFMAKKKNLKFVLF